MKQATKNNIILSLLWMVFALGFVSIVYEIGTYFFDLAGFLTPYAIWAWGFGLMIGSSIGIIIIRQKKRRYRK